MNKRIKELAEQAGFNKDFLEHNLEKFAELIRADEREACAKLAEKELHTITVLTSMPLQSSAAFPCATTATASRRTWTILQKIKARGEVK